MRMIDDRLGYGLFLDYYLSNLLMDVFIKEQNYRGLPIINKYIFFKYYKSLKMFIVLYRRRKSGNPVDASRRIRSSHH